MIKSPLQLKNAEKRLNEIQNIMLENSKKYNGLDLEMYNIGLAREESELLDEIIEYKKLRTLPFADAISLLFSKPILIDNIGDLLTKLRIAAKLSQVEMAHRLGWQQSNLSRFENENYGAQTISKIVEYASTLGVWLHVFPSLTEEPITYDRNIQAATLYRNLNPDLSIASTGHTANFTDDYDSTMLEIGTSQPDIIEATSI